MLIRIGRVVTVCDLLPAVEGSLSEYIVENISAHLIFRGVSSSRSVELIACFCFQRGIQRTISTFRRKGQNHCGGKRETYSFVFFEKILHHKNFPYTIII